MAQWTRNKVDGSKINNGNEYEKKDRVSRQQLNSIVNNSFYASDVADNANTKSDNAVNTANEALEQATNAVIVSGQANTKADNALQNSQTAISTANHAEEVAQNVVASANSAVAIAETAKQTANTAKQTAETATTTANAATTTANAASADVTRLEGEVEEFKNRVITGQGTAIEKDGEQLNDFEVSEIPTANAGAVYDSNGNIKTNAPFNDSDCIRLVDLFNIVNGGGINTPLYDSENSNIIDSDNNVIESFITLK